MVIVANLHPSHKVFTAVTNSKKWIPPTGISGFACNFLAQLGIMIVVVVHSVLQAVPTSSDASWL